MINRKLRVATSSGVEEHAIGWDFVFRNMYKGHTGKTKGGWDPRWEVGIAGVGGSCGSKMETTILNNNKKSLKKRTDYLTAWRVGGYSFYLSLYYPYMFYIYFIYILNNLYTYLTI